MCEQPSWPSGNFYSKVSSKGQYHTNPEHEKCSNRNSQCYRREHSAGPEGMESDRARCEFHQTRSQGSYISLYAGYALFAAQTTHSATSSLRPTVRTPQGAL